MSDAWIERGVWAIIVIALLYFGAHLVIATRNLPTDRPPCYMEDDTTCGPRR